MKLAFSNLPLWTTATPHYAVHLLGAVLSAAGHEVVFPELETGLYRAAGPEVRALWNDAAHWYDAALMAELGTAAAPWFEQEITSLAAAGVELICLSVAAPSLLMVGHFVQAVRRVAPELKVCCGGPAAFAGGEQLLKATGCDVVVVGEGELTLPALVAALAEGRDLSAIPGLLFMRAGAVVNTGQGPRLPDLAALPAPDWRRIDFSRYTAAEPTISTTLSRGCLQRCAYCAESPQFGAFRARPGQKLAEEVIAVVTHHRLQRLHVLLNDSAINGSPADLAEFARGIAHLDCLITFSGMATASEDLTDTALAALKAAGCNRLSFGIETGSQAVLDSMGKKSHTAAGSLEVVHRVHAAGLEAEAYFIVGFPSEGEAEFHETLDWIRRAWPSLKGLSINILQLLPGARVYAHPERWQVQNLGTADWSTPQHNAAIRATRCRILTMLFKQKLGSSAVRPDGLADPNAELTALVAAAKATLHETQAVINGLTRRA